MLKGYSQSEIIGVQPKNHTSVDLGISLFEENPLVFDTDYKPGLEVFTGNISSSLGASLMLATGRLSVSPTFMKLAMQEACITLPENQLRSEISLSMQALQRDGIVTSSPDKWILNDFGQVFCGSFWQVAQGKSGQLIKGLMAYTQAFGDLPCTDDIEPWAIATGLKVKDPANTRNVIKMISLFGDDPEQTIDLYTGGGRAKNVNPLYPAARRLMEAGLVKTVDAGHKLTVVDSQVDRMRRLSNRVNGYDTLLNITSNKQCNALTEVNPTACLGINEDRWNLIRSAAYIYRGLRAQNNQNKPA